MSRSALITVLLAFVLSVAVRWPLVNRPLSAHHEYCTAFTLIALTNWWEDGYSTHHGMPSGGFVREGEQLFPTAQYDRNVRATSLYYFSHPPLAFELPYVLFVLAGQAPNAAGLQWVNIVFHLVAALAFFLVVHMAMGSERPNAPLYATVFYLLLPVTLWFHGNAYMSDMFVQVPWLVHLVFAMRLLQRGAKVGQWWWVGYTITLFLTMYTSWLGVFAAVAEIVVAAGLWWRNRKVALLSIFGACLVAGAVAFGLTAWRFLQVIDGEALVVQLGSRLAERDSFGAETEVLPLLVQLSTNYRIGFLPLLLLLGLLLVNEVVRSTRAWFASKDLVLFVLLTGLPVLLDHAILLQYATHDFAMLKAAPLACGLASWLLCRQAPKRRRIVLAITCLASILYFYRTNPLPGYDDGRYAQERDLGRFIATHAKPNEVVFGLGISTEPQVRWYARRNVIGIRDAQAARILLRERGLERGVLIKALGKGYSATRITP